MSDAEQPIRGGMSGSPILAKDGSAIGIVCTGRVGENGQEDNDGSPNPSLSHNLPGWLLRELKRM